MTKEHDNNLDSEVMWLNPLLRLTQRITHSEVNVLKCNVNVQHNIHSDLIAMPTLAMKISVSAG